MANKWTEGEWSEEGIRTGFSTGPATSSTRDLNLFLTWNMGITSIPIFLQGYFKDNILTSHPGITYPSSHSPYATTPSITWLLNAAKILTNLFLLPGIPSPGPPFPSDFCSCYCLWEVSSFWLPLADLGVSIVPHVAFTTGGSTSVSFTGLWTLQRKELFIFVYFSTLQCFGIKHTYMV